MNGITRLKMANGQLSISTVTEFLPAPLLSVPFGEKAGGSV
jgi:hypothetical protein